MRAIRLATLWTVANRLAPVGRWFRKHGALLSCLLIILSILAPRDTGRPPRVLSPISADEFVQALASHRASLIELYLREDLDRNARASHDRPLAVAAALEQDWETVRRLIKAGASPDLGDEDGTTILMIAADQGRIDILRELLGVVTSVDVPDRNGRSVLEHAVTAKNMEVMEFLLPFVPDLTRHGSGLLAAALDSGDMKIAERVLERIPPLQEWSSSALRILEKSITTGDRAQVRLLLQKHVVPPHPEGSNVPLLAYAITEGNEPVFNMLLICGADPNTVLPEHCDKNFLVQLKSRYLRNFIEDDREVTMLMLAAGLGQTDYVRALIDAGASRDRRSARYKMIPLYLSAQSGYWRCTQILLGGGPSPEQLRLEISLASQKVALIKDGVPIFNTICSTGMGGRFATRAGDYVITDKDRYHVSTIYKVGMPYFMRLNCLDFGMHEGYVPNYPASHGCIRLPGDAARRFFAELPLGTLVSVK